MISMNNSGDKHNHPRKITRRGFLRATRNVFLGSIFWSLGGWKYAAFERGWIKITREVFQIPGLPAAFSGLTVAHLSDLHFNDWMTPERFEEVVIMVNEMAADMIVITGDILDRGTVLTQTSEYIALLTKLAAPRGKYAVLGNHDHWRASEVSRQMMAESGIEDLSNRTVRLGVEQDSLYICGLDSYVIGKQNLKKVLSELPQAAPAILLVHEPDYADVSAITGRFSLQLSGHSHGGQVDLPLFGPPVTPKFGRKYPRGRYQIGEMHLFTSTGIGMVAPYIRLNCRPEIGMYTLEAA
ncbi:MAG: metallophosphoesterase [Anaerolineales bacterium]|nr:metallophosphoesterase [Anaerolineales bacterium]